MDITVRVGLENELGFSFNESLKGNVSNNVVMNDLKGALVSHLDNIAHFVDQELYLLTDKLPDIDVQKVVLDATQNASGLLVGKLKALNSHT